MVRGNKIAVVAPGGAVSAEKLEAGLAFLRKLGLDPILGMHVYDRYRYLAGTSRDRWLDLEWALTAPDIGAVWFARGGYGTAQLLDEIPWDRVVKARPVIGFSDATALLLALARRGIESIHGPVLTSLADGPQGLTEASLQAMIALLLSGEPTFLPGIPLGGPAAVVEGPVLGGNLAVLASLAGTVHALQGSGSILVLEDVGESPYRIERLLCQLIDSGALVGVKGIALGEFTGCQPPDGATYQLLDIFLEHLLPLNIPVLHQLPVGHGQRNIAFPYGRIARMDVLGIRFTSTGSCAAF